MKSIFSQITAFCLAIPVFAGESGLIRTFQPLGGIAAPGISVEAVTCYVSNFHSHQATPIEYIATKNIPPTNSDKESGDLNLASTSHIYFEFQNSEAKEPKLSMQTDEFAIPVSYKREDIVRACLECLRRVLPPEQLKTKLSFTSSLKNREWMGKIVSEFNHCDRGKVFYEYKEE